MVAEHRRLPVSRRRFVQGAVVAGLGLLAGCGRWAGPPPPRVARIGLLSPGGSSSPYAEALWQGLQELGWEEGRNLVIERRFAGEHPGELPNLATELARVPVEAIVASGPPAIQAAMAATSTVPIVIIQTADAVASGFVANLARPGGNVTGLSALGRQLSEKRLELLKQAIPGLSRVALLWTPNLPGRETEFDALRGVAKVLALELLAVEFKDSGDLDSAITPAMGQRAGALLVQESFLSNRLGARIAELAIQNRLPSVAARREFALVGGLVGHGTSAAAQYRRAAYYVDRILKGAKPAELPVEQPREFDFVINLQTAQTLGLTIPQHVLLQATEVIQ
jgi:putative ABC transport system substrate-binding protein